MDGHSHTDIQNDRKYRGLPHVTKLQIGVESFISRWGLGVCLLLFGEGRGVNFYMIHNF